MKPTLWSVLCALLVLPAHGDELADTQRFIDGLIASPPQATSQRDAQAIAAQTGQPLSADNQAWLTQQRHQAGAATEVKPAPRARYFVSFSLPDAGLKRLILDADTFGIPATLRGMVKGDMRETANAVLRLVNEDKRGGVQIDPKAFTTYGINAVPALVVTCDGHYDRIAGNLAVRDALTKVAEAGDCADTAKAILAAHPTPDTGAQP